MAVVTAATLALKVILLPFFVNFVSSGFSPTTQQRAPPCAAH